MNRRTGNSISWSVIVAAIVVLVLVKLIGSAEEAPMALAPTAASATSAATPSPERPNQTTIENDLRLAKIGTNLQKLGAAASARGQQSDDPAVKLQALVEGAADEIVGCEVWSSMASTTTPDMDDVCKQERGVMNSLPPETQAAIQRQLVVVRTELGEGRYPQ